MPSFSGKRVTLQDVARATGYTANTVSRALKNKPDISAETSKKIQDAARRMGYVRNAMACSLRSGHTRTLGVIVGGMSNPYYGRMTDSIQDAAAEEGYSLLIFCSRDDPELEYQLIETAISRQVDGILLQMVCKLLLLPVLVGIAYEINRYVGRHDNSVTRFVTAPGLWLQNFTTNPPDDSMIEVGIASLKAVIPEKKGQDAW